jgi:WD40 repeat protein
VTADGNFAITASSNNCSIKVWDMSTLRSVSKFVGHSSSISGLTVSKDNNFLLSSAVDERFLNLWRLNELELLTKKKTAVASAKKGAAKRGEKAQLVLDDDETASSSSSGAHDDGDDVDEDDEDDSGKGKQPKKSYSSKSSPIHSNISPFHTNGSSYHVLSVTGSCVSVWEYEVDGESSAKPVSEVRLGRSDRQNPIIWADFSDETTIIVVRGPHFKPHFEKLVCPLFSSLLFSSFSFSFCFFGF